MVADPGHESPTTATRWSTAEHAPTVIWVQVRESTPWG